MPDLKTRSTSKVDCGVSIAGGGGTSRVDVAAGAARLGVGSNLASSRPLSWIDEGIRAFLTAKRLDVSSSALPGDATEIARKRDIAQAVVTQMIGEVSSRVASLEAEGGALISEIEALAQQQANLVDELDAGLNQLSRRLAADVIVPCRMSTHSSQVAELAHLDATQRAITRAVTILENVRDWDLSARSAENLVQRLGQRLRDSVAVSPGIASDFGGALPTGAAVAAPPEYPSTEDFEAIQHLTKLMAGIQEALAAMENVLGYAHRLATVHHVLGRLQPLLMRTAAIVTVRELWRLATSELNEPIGSEADGEAQQQQPYRLLFEAALVIGGPLDLAAMVTVVVQVIANAVLRTAWRSCADGWLLAPPPILGSDSADPWMQGLLKQTANEVCRVIDLPVDGGLTPAESTEQFLTVLAGLVDKPLLSGIISELAAALGTVGRCVSARLTTQSGPRAMSDLGPEFMEEPGTVELHEVRLVCFGTSRLCLIRRLEKVAVSIATRSLADWFHEIDREDISLQTEEGLEKRLQHLLDTSHALRHLSFWMPPDDFMLAVTSKRSSLSVAGKRVVGALASVILPPGEANERLVVAEPSRAVTGLSTEESAAATCANVVDFCGEVPCDASLIRVDTRWVDDEAVRTAVTLAVARARKVFGLSASRCWEMFGDRTALNPSTNVVAFAKKQVYHVCGILRWPELFLRTLPIAGTTLPRTADQRDTHVSPPPQQLVRLPSDWQTYWAPRLAGPAKGALEHILRWMLDKLRTEYAEPMRQYVQRVVEESPVDDPRGLQAATRSLALTIQLRAEILEPLVAQLNQDLPPTLSTVAAGRGPQTLTLLACDAEDIADRLTIPAAVPKVSLPAAELETARLQARLLVIWTAVGSLSLNGYGESLASLAEDRGKEAQFASYLAATAISGGAATIEFGNPSLSSLGPGLTAGRSKGGSDYAELPISLRVAKFTERLTCLAAILPEFGLAPSHAVSSCLAGCMSLLGVLFSRAEWSDSSEPVASQELSEIEIGVLPSVLIMLMTQFAREVENVRLLNVPTIWKIFVDAHQMLSTYRTLAGHMLAPSTQPWVSTGDHSVGAGHEDSSGVASRADASAGAAPASSGHMFRQVPGSQSIQSRLQIATWTLMGIEEGAVAVLIECWPFAALESEAVIRQLVPGDDVDTLTTGISAEAANQDGHTIVRQTREKIADLMRRKLPSET